MRLFKTAQGRSSILLAIEGLARKDKKFIITQSFTCVAVPEAIIKSGFKPFWLDIELQTFSIDLEKFKEALKKYEREFAALIFQHTYLFQQLVLFLFWYILNLMSDKNHF